MKQNYALQYTTVVKLSHFYWNGASSSLVKNIYNYNANIVGSDPYWFQHRKLFTA